MTHQLAERKGEVYRSKCGVDAKKGETTVWNGDVSCPACIAKTPYLANLVRVLPKAPRIRLIRRRKRE